MLPIVQFVKTRKWLEPSTIIGFLALCVAFFSIEKNPIWLYLMFLGILLILAVLLCISLRQAARKQAANERDFDFMLLITCIICILLGVTSIVAIFPSDSRAKQELPPTSTSTPTFTAQLTSTSTSPHTSTPTPVSTSIAPSTSPLASPPTVIQGDLLETWAYITRMWDPAGKTLPYARLLVENEPDRSLDPDGRSNIVFTYQFGITVTEAYVGFDYVLDPVTDFSSYDSMQVEFRYSDDATRCLIGLKDNEGSSVLLSLGPAKEGEYWTTATFPLKTFTYAKTHPKLDPINLHAVMEVVVGTDHPVDYLSHSCTINSIKFLRP